MKCKICGARMKLKAEDRYEIPCFVKHRKFEAFNCRKCGCQNIVNVKEVDINERFERVDG